MCGQGGQEQVLRETRYLGVKLFPGFSGRCCSRPGAMGHGADPQGWVPGALVEPVLFGDGRPNVCRAACVGEAPSSQTPHRPGGEDQPSGSQDAKGGLDAEMETCALSGRGAGLWIRGLFGVELSAVRHVTCVAAARGRIAGCGPWGGLRGPSQGPVLAGAARLGLPTTSWTLLSVWTAPSAQAVSSLPGRPTDRAQGFPPLGGWSRMSNSGVIPGGKKCYFQLSHYCPVRVWGVFIPCCLFVPSGTAAGALSSPASRVLAAGSWCHELAPDGEPAGQRQLGPTPAREQPEATGGQTAHVGSPWPGLLPVTCFRRP